MIQKTLYSIFQQLKALSWNKSKQNDPPNSFFKKKSFNRMFSFEDGENLR